MPFPFRNSMGGVPGILADYKPFSSDTEFLLAIEKEQRVELAFENYRWFDLVRTECVKDVMIQEQKEQTGFSPSFWSDNLLLLPIPLQVTQSDPEKIKQNPGLKGYWKMPFSSHSRTAGAVLMSVAIMLIHLFLATQ